MSLSKPLRERAFLIGSFINEIYSMKYIENLSLDEIISKFLEIEGTSVKIIDSNTAHLYIYPEHPQIYWILDMNSDILQYIRS